MRLWWISVPLVAGSLGVGAWYWIRRTRYRRRQEERQEALLSLIHYHTHSLHLMGREVYRRVMGREPPQPPRE